MPIGKDRFEALDEDDTVPAPGTNADRILRFLRSHPDMAFTRGEIVEETKIPQGSVGPTLVRLRERGRVDHRGRYWRVSDHDGSLDDAVGHSAAALDARETDGETPRKDEWAEHAVDPRDNRDDS